MKITLINLLSNCTLCAIIIYDWIVGPGENALQRQLQLGSSTEAAEELLRVHAQLENKSDNMFATIANLKKHFDKLSRSLEHPDSGFEASQKDSIPKMLGEVKYNIQTVEETCRIFEGKLKRREALLQRSLQFFKTKEEVSASLCKLANFCANEASLLDSRDCINTLLHQLHDGNQMTNRELQKLYISAQIFSDLMKKEQDCPYISRRSHVRVDYSKEIRFVHWSANKMTENVKQIEETCELYKNQLQHILELKDSQHNASQTIEWMGEMAENIKTKHFALGANANETEILRLQHEEIKNTAKKAYDNGKKNLSCISILRRTLDLSPGASKSPSNSLRRAQNCSHHVGTSGTALPTLEEAWKTFTTVWEERNSRLAVAYLFHSNSERIIHRGSQLGSDLDLAFKSTNLDTSSPSRRRRSISLEPKCVKISPLREAHMSLNDEMDHVIKAGNSILQDSQIRTEVRTDPVTSAIQAKMKHLDFLRSSLHRKWSKIERRKNALSPGSTFMEAMKECTDWIRMKLVECCPNTFDIGKSLNEAVELRENHRGAMQTLQTKERHITLLLSQAKAYCEDDSFDRQNSSKSLYEAMAQSLSDLWQELKSHLNKRHHLLGKSIGFYESAVEFDRHLTYLEQYLRWKDLPGDKTSSQSLLETHKEMRRNMLEASTLCLTHGQNLLEILKNWKKSQPDGHQANYGSACTAIECALESLIDRRRQVEHGYEIRKEQLERSLRSCHWESEVKEVVNWFENAKHRYFTTKDLGDNLERAEEMQCHLEDIRKQAQTRLERAKGLLLRAEERLDVTGEDTATTKAQQLDVAGENFMRMLDERKEELLKAESFFRATVETNSSLAEIRKNLDNMVFSTDLEELETQCATFLEAIALSYKPAEDLAREILKNRYDEETDQLDLGAKGVESVIRGLKEKKDALEKTVIKYRQEAIRINEMARMFFSSCQELTDWFTQQACDMLGRYTSLGGDQSEAQEFLDWHKQLIGEIKKKNSDLESLVETANVLLEAGVSRPTAVRDRAEELKADMTRINKIAHSRTSLAENFTNFLVTTDKVSKAMTKLRSMLASDHHDKLNKMPEEQRSSLREELQEVQENCLNAIDSGQNLVSPLKEGIEDDNLLTEESVSRVHETVKRLKEEKDDLLDLWLTWQYRSNVGKDVEVQWKNVQNTTDRLMKAMDNLEKAVFINDEVRLGEDAASTQALTTELVDRMHLLQSIHGEIEKVVKLSEMLGLRAPPTRTPQSSENNSSRESYHQSQNSADEKEDLVRSLLARHQGLQDRLKNYNMALITAKQVYRDAAQLEKLLADTKKDMQEKEILAATEGALSNPKKESYVTLLLRNHDRLKISVDELVKSVTSGTFGVHQIINQLSLGRLHKPSDRPSIDKTTMDISAANTTWQKIWQDYRETLLNQLNTAWYTLEFRKQKQRFDEVQRAISALEGSLQSCTNKSIATSLNDEHERLSLKMKQPYEECASFIDKAQESIGRSNPRQLDVDDLKKSWWMTRQRLERIKQTIIAYENYYELALQCDDWEYEMKNTLSAIKQRSECDDRPSCTSVILQQLEKDIFSRVSEQENRIKEMRRIFTEQISHSPSLINTQRSSAKRHDFIQELLTSFRDEALTLKQKLEQQQHVRAQQDEYQKRQKVNWEQSKQQPRQTLAQNVTNRVQESMRYQPEKDEPIRLRSIPDIALPPQPPPLPAYPPLHSTMKFQAKPTPSTSLSRITDKSPGRRKLMEELANENLTVTSSTSGYSTLTDATKQQGMEKNGCNGYNYANKQVTALCHSGRSQTNREENSSSYPRPLLMKKSLDAKVKSDFQVGASFSNRSTSARVPSHTSLKSKAPESGLNLGFERAGQSSLRKKYAGKPRASWESQIEQDLTVEEGKLFERPLAFSESAESEQSGDISSFTPVCESFTSVTADETACETISTVTSTSEEFVLNDETTASDTSTVESIRVVEPVIHQNYLGSENGNCTLSSTSSVNHGAKQDIPKSPKVKISSILSDTGSDFDIIGSRCEHDPPSPPPRRHGSIRNQALSQGTRRQPWKSPIQRVKNKDPDHGRNTASDSPDKQSQAPGKEMWNTEDSNKRGHELRDDFANTKLSAQSAKIGAEWDKSHDGFEPKLPAVLSTGEIGNCRQERWRKGEDEAPSQCDSNAAIETSNDPSAERLVAVQYRPDSAVGTHYFSDQEIKQSQMVTIEKQVKIVKKMKKKDKAEDIPEVKQAIYQSSLPKSTSVVPTAPLKLATSDANAARVKTTVVSRARLKSYEESASAQTVQLPQNASVPKSTQVSSPVERAEHKILNPSAKNAGKLKSAIIEKANKNKHDEKSLQLQTFTPLHSSLPEQRFSSKIGPANTASMVLVEKANNEVGKRCQSPSHTANETAQEISIDVSSSDRKERIVPVELRRDCAVQTHFYVEQRVKESQNVTVDRVQIVKTSKKKNLPMRLAVNVKPKDLSEVELSVAKKPDSPPMEGVVYRNQKKAIEIFNFRRKLQRRASDSETPKIEPGTDKKTPTYSRSFVYSSLRRRAHTPQPRHVSKESRIGLAPTPIFASVKVATVRERRVKSVSPAPIHMAVHVRPVSPTSSESTLEPSSPVPEQTPAAKFALASKEILKISTLPAEKHLATFWPSPILQVTSQTQPVDRETQTSPSFAIPKVAGSLEIQSKSRSPAYLHAAVFSNTTPSPSPTSSITSGGTSELMGLSPFLQSPQDSSFETWSSFPCPSLYSVTSQCDTDCLVVADARTGMIPDQLSDAATDELLDADPYAKESKSTKPKREGRVICEAPELKMNEAVIYKKSLPKTPQELVVISPPLQAQSAKEHDASETTQKTDKNTREETRTDLTFALPTKADKLLSPTNLNAAEVDALQNNRSKESTSLDIMAGSEFHSPRFNLPLESVEVDEGGTAKFEAVVTGFPIPAVKWLHKGNDVTNSINYEITSDATGRCSLFIPEVFDEDAGLFTCYAANGAGEADSSAELVVKTKTVAPQFAQHLKGAHAVQGETVHFEVKTTGLPGPRVKWYREGAEIRNSDDFRMVSDGDTHTLTIAEAYEEDTGQFTVTATNNAGKATSTAMLTVSGEGSVASSGVQSGTPPAFQYSKQPVEAAREREEITTAGPTGIDFVQASESTMQSSGASSHLARKQSPSPIRRVRMSPPRMHPAVGSQQPPLPRRQIRSVKPPAASGVQTAATAAQGKPESTDKERAVFPPFFKVPAKNVEVVEGEMSQFETHVIGNPNPTIKWYREGALIESSQDFLITYDGQMSALLIRETFVDDAGMFTCTAQNKTGSTSCSALLTVTVLETEDEAGTAYKPGFVRSISETELSMTDYDGFESTELDFVSGVSDMELTDTELGKPPVAHHHFLDAVDHHVGKKLSPVAEEASAASSAGKKSSSATGQKAIAGTPPTMVSAPPAILKLDEGGSLRLSFVISGSPPPNVTWAKNGRPIRQGYKFKLKEDLPKHTFTLLVDTLVNDDAGEYTITATNRFGFIRGIVNLMTEDSYQYQKMTQPGMQASEDKTLTQQISMPRQPVSRGRGESRRQTTTSRKHVSPGEGGRMPSLSPGAPDRRSVSPSKRIEEVEELDIEKYFKPKFLRKPENLECNEGTATRINCKVTGRPMPEVLWHHNGVLMHEDYSHRLIVKEDGVRSLIISPATPRDGGEYTVVAQNKAGKAISSVTLTVIPKEGTERPRILEKPQSVNVNEGDVVRLEVFAVGRPTPEIVWLKDNVLLIPDKHPELRIEGVDGHGLLTIPDATRVLHDAWYTATAVNKVGRDLTRCKVKVNPREIEPEPERKLYIPKSARKLLPPEASPDRIETRKIDNFDETDLYDEKRLQKPRIKKKLVSVKQKLLGSAHFECHIVPIGDPTMKVDWLHDGKPIEFANRIMITHEFGYCALDINAVYPRDSGVISCRATNAHGQVQSSCTLMVKDTKGLVEVSQLPEKQHLENIQRREKEFRGIGEKYALKHPTDEEPPHAPHIVLDLDPARVKEGEPARFRCRITGYPPPKVEWHLNEQSIRKSKRFRLWYDGIHYFEIANVRAYDIGEVRMVATNSQGKVESRAALEVYQAEDFRSVLHQADKVPSTDGDMDLTVKRYRTSRAIEDQMRGENARKMVSQLKQVEKPSLAGQKKPGIKLTGKELESKFRHLSEEEHIKQAYRVEQKIVFYDEDNEAPVIIERVHNVTVTKGEDVRLKVRFYGKPRPEVTWFFNGRPLEQSDRISWQLVEEFVSELSIRNARKEDSGGISVKVKNVAGESGSQGFLLVQEPNVLRFTHPLQDVSAKENDRSCMFECALSEPYTRVEWRTTAGRKGDTVGYETVLKEGGKYRMNSEGSHQYLRITDVKIIDAGTYYCVVWGQDEKQTCADLVVEAVPRKITSGLSDVTSREGFAARYEAVVSHEDVSGTWMKDGEAIQASGKYEVTGVGLKRRLDINDLTIEDEGVYEYAYNGDSSSANLTVTALPCNIVQTLSDQTAFAGNTVKFEAKLSLFGAKCHWFKDGMPLTPTDRIGITSDMKTHTLTITSCNAGDPGRYSLKAGTGETTAELVVQEIVVTGFLKNQTVLESQSTILQCAVDVPGYFDGIWLHNERLVTNTEYHVIETKGTSQMLTLTNVTSDDAGAYAYVTGSGTGTEARLDVTPISVTRPLRDVTDAETKSAKLDLELSHGGVEGTWWKDGVQLQGSESDKYVFGSDGRTRYLEIRSLSIDDQGIYEFRAGKQMDSCQVTVQGTQIITPLHDARALETGEVKLECEVARPGVRGKWKCNGVEIKFDSSHAKNEYRIDGKKHSLIMRDIDQNYAGTYTFEFGSAKTSANVAVEGIKLMKALRNIHVADASDAVFAVEVSQDGVRNAKWERNGVELRPDDAKYVMTSEGRKHTLTVKNVSHEDVAAYSFVAGSAKSSGRIYVENIDFARKLQDQHIMEKRTTEFVVEVDNDNVSGYWTKDGVKLQPSDKYQIRSEHKIHQLTIANTDASDAGVYTFNVGRSQTSSRLTVETVKITSKMKPVSIKETQTGVFQCTVSHPDITSNMYAWKKNGIEIRSSERISITVEAFTHRLTLRDCTLEDSGEYVFEVGKDKCKSKLDVQVVKVIRPLAPKQKVMAHETAVFETQIDAADVKAYWMKDGRRIDVTSRLVDSSSKFEARTKDTIHILKIKDVTAEDEGIYTLYAGRELTSSTLYVEVVQVDITKCVKTISVVEQQQATLEFRVSKPNVKAQWFRQGIEIDINQPRYRYEIDDRSHRLYVKEITFADEGEYTFQAGNQRATTFLYVQPSEPPQFVQELRNCIVIAGEQARFTVRVSGRPEPTITWYKEGVSLQPSFKYKILHDEDQHTLVLVGVEESDAGRYLCEAKNELGIMRTTATLEVDTKDKTPVIRQPDIVAPKIVEHIQDFITREGQSARFQCKVTGTDPRVTWFVNNKRIHPSRYFKISHFHGVHQLEITEAYPEDEGVYRVTVSNSKDEVSCSAKLQLDIVPPKVIEPLQPAHVIEGSPVKFECIMHGDDLKVKWYLSGRDITQASKYQWGLEENGHCWLVVAECHRNDAGEVRCHCSNASGEAVCSTDLMVTGLFEATLDQDAAVAEGCVDALVEKIGKFEPAEQSLGNVTEIISGSMGGSEAEDNFSKTVLVTSAMTGKEFTIKKSEAAQLVRMSYISHSQFDPSLPDTPVLLRKRETDLDEDLVRPAFTQKLKPVAAKRNSSAEFICRFIAAPRPQISWFHNNQPLKNGGRIQITTERDMFSYTALLEIEDCAAADAGEYRVIVKNKEGECQSCSELDVTMRPVPLIPRLNLKDVTNEEEPKRKLRTPRTPTRRYLERVRLRDSPRARVLREDYRRTRSLESPLNGSTRSTLSDVGPQFSSSLVNNFLTTSNYSSRDKKVGSITNGGDDSQTNGKQMDDDTCSISTLTSTLRQFHATNGYSPARARLSNDARSISLDYPDCSSDVVTHSTASTSGVFMMDDSIGSRRSSISRSREGPVIIEELPDTVKLVSGSELYLSCTVSGRPRPTPVWLKDAEKISENSKPFIFEESEIVGSGYTFSLRVKNLLSDMAGVYTFSALNVAGDVSSTSNVTILPEEEKFEAPNFTKKLKATKAKPGDKVRLECKLTGSSPIQVIWSKDGKQLSKSQLVGADENSSHLEICQLSQSDCGEYSIMAKNTYGVATCSASLIVEGP